MHAPQSAVSCLLSLMIEVTGISITIRLKSLCVCGMVISFLGQSTDSSCIRQSHAATLSIKLGEWRWSAAHFDVLLVWLMKEFNRFVCDSNTCLKLIDLSSCCSDLSLSLSLSKMSSLLFAFLKLDSIWFDLIFGCYRILLPPLWTRTSFRFFSVPLFNWIWLLWTWCDDIK